MSILGRILIGGGAGDNVNIIDPPPPMMPPRGLRDPFGSQAGIYSLPFTRQQLVNPTPTPTDPNNLMDRLNALYSRTITPYIKPDEDNNTGGGVNTLITGGTGGGGTGGGGTGGGGTGGGTGGGARDRRDIIDDIRRDREERRFDEIMPPSIGGIGGINDNYIPGIDDRFKILEDQIANLKDNPFSPPPFDPSLLEKDIASLREQVIGIPALIPEIPTQFDPSALQNQIDILNQREIPTFNPIGLQNQIDKLSLGLGDLTRNISDDRLNLMDNILDEVDNRFSPSRLGMGMGRVS